MANPNISEIVTSAIENRTKRLADNVTHNNALLMKLEKRGKIRTVDGGTAINQELSYAENSTYKRYSGYEVLNVSPSDVITSAQYAWKQAAVAVTISGLEQLQNSGSEKMIDLLESRIMVAESTMRNNISADLHSDGTADDGKQINGLRALVSGNPNAGIVGGINRAIWNFWRNVAPAAEALTSDNIKGKMQATWVQLVRGTDKPDLILADNALYTTYWSAVQAQERFVNKDMANAGFENIQFNSAPVVLDGGVGGSIPANHMYFLNCDYLHWRPHKDRNFRTLPGDRQAVNQDALIRLIVWAGNLTMSNASLQGVLRGN